MVSYNDFKQIELQIATIISAEPVPGSDKLVKLQINLGKENRQLLAGLAEFYTPTELINQQIVVVTNLEPKKLLGIESQGMLLATNTQPPILLQPAKPVLPGTRVFWLS